VEAIQGDPNLVSSDREVSILLGGESYDTLKDHTPDLDRYADPLKVLHNTLFPEDIKKAEDDEFLKSQKKK
jgi:hypothetical protein